MSVGTIYVKTRIRLEMDIDEADVNQFVNELDYHFEGGIVEGVNLIAETEITDFEAIS